MLLWQCYVVDAKLYDRHWLCRGTNGPHSLKAGAVLKECGSPPSSSSLQTLNDLFLANQVVKHPLSWPSLPFPSRSLTIQPLVMHLCTPDVALNVYCASPEENLSQFHDRICVCVYVVERVSQTNGWLVWNEGINRFDWSNIGGGLSEGITFPHPLDVRDDGTSMIKADRMTASLFVCLFLCLHTTVTLD